MRWTSSLLAFCLAGVIGGSAQAQTQGFGTFYAFGDSLTDAGRLGRSIGDAPLWIDYAAAAVGARNSGIVTNYAVGGASSVGFLGQAAQFRTEVPRIAPNDILGIWIGTNDVWPSALTANPPGLFQPLGSQPAISTLAAFTAGNVRGVLLDAAARGARNAVLIGVYDLGQTAIYDFYPGNTNAQTLGYATAASIAYNDQLRAMAIPGVNVRFVDTFALLQRVQASPNLYGFTGGTTARNNCIAAGCASVADQQRYVFNDVLHFTTGFQSFIGLYVANMLLAPETLPVQAELGKVAGQAFSTSLLDRLDGARFAAPFAVPVSPGSPFSLFTTGIYGTGDRQAQTTATGPTIRGYDYDLGGASIGGEYRTREVVLGAAFNYAHLNVDRRRVGGADTEANSYQGAVFGSLFYANAFLDAAVTYGANQYEIRRAGVVDTLTSSPTGNTFTAAGKGGYLFDVGAFKLGPVAGLAYTQVQVDPYSERGDPLLTIGVRRQSLDGLTGSAGAQLRTSFAAGSVVLNPYVNLTAEHEFLDDVRTITSFQTNAPLLLIRTDGTRDPRDTYGRVAGGVMADFSPTFSGFARGSATFGRSRGDDYTANAGVAARF